MAHRAYQPTKPVASKMLSKKWDDAAFDQHKEKVKTAKPSVDNKPPKTYMHLQLKMKKLQMEEERQATIERDNRMLLEKMSNIMQTKGSVDNKNDYEHKSLNKSVRQADLLRITHENQALLKRISAKQPHYDTEEWDKDYDYSRQLKGQITAYPESGKKGTSPSKGKAAAAGKEEEAEEDEFEEPEPEGEAEGGEAAEATETASGEEKEEEKPAEGGAAGSD